MNKKIVVVNYDPKWAQQFAVIKHVLQTHLDGYTIEIEHVGSTSIIGLYAKPIIDLDIIVDNDDEDDASKLQEIIKKLGELGYVHIGDLGVEGREAFKKISERTPDTGTGKTWFEHHLYLCRKGSIGLQNHLKFRDYMRSNPEKVLEYGNLKMELAKKFPHDIDRYIDGKTDFIVGVLMETGIDEDTKKEIERANRLK